MHVCELQETTSSAFFKHGDENLILTAMQWTKMYGPHLMVNENSSNCCIVQVKQSTQRDKWVVTEYEIPVLACN